MGCFICNEERSAEEESFVTCWACECRVHEECAERCEEGARALFLCFACCENDGELVGMLKMLLKESL